MNTVTIEVVVGLAFLYFVLSIVASAVSEAISGALNLRGNTLHRGIANLLTGELPLPAKPAVVDDQAPPASDGETFWRVYTHPLVSSYGGRRQPSYLSASSFRDALLDSTRVLDAGGLQEGLDRLPAGGQVQKVLTSLARSVQYDEGRFRTAIEQWYDRSMERVSGWYKRNTQIMLFVVGFLLALAINANAGQAALRLWNDDSLRHGLVAEAQADQEGTGRRAALRELRTLGFPIGWEKANRPDGTPIGVAAAVGGWILTGVAITFGAPFWFDVLNRFSNLRAAGPKPGSVLPGADRQDTGATAV